MFPIVIFFFLHFGFTIFGQQHLEIRHLTTSISPQKRLPILFSMQNYATKMCRFMTFVTNQHTINIIYTFHRHKDASMSDFPAGKLYRKQLQIPV